MSNNTNQQEPSQDDEPQWEDCADDEPLKANVESIFPKSLFSNIAHGCREKPLIVHHSYYAWRMFIDLFTQPDFGRLRAIIAERMPPVFTAEVVSHLDLLLDRKLSPEAMLHDYVFRRTLTTMRIFVEVLMHVPRDSLDWANARLDALDGIFWLLSLLKDKRALFAKDAIRGTVDLLGNILETGLWIESNDWTLELQAFAEEGNEHLEMLQKDAKHVLEVTPRILGVMVSEDVGKKLGDGVSHHALDQVCKMCHRLIKKIEGTTAGDNGRAYEHFFWSDFFDHGGQISSFSAVTLQRDFLAFFLSTARSVAENVKFYAGSGGGNDRIGNFRRVPHDVVDKLFSTPITVDAQEKFETLDQYFRTVFPKDAVDEAYYTEYILDRSASKSLRNFCTPEFYYRKEVDGSVGAYIEYLGKNRAERDAASDFYIRCSILGNSVMSMFKLLPDQTITPIYDLFASPTFSSNNHRDDGNDLPLVKTMLYEFVPGNPRELASLLLVLSVPFAGRREHADVFPLLEQAFTSSCVFHIDREMCESGAGGDIHVLRGISLALPVATCADEATFLDQLADRQKKIYTTNTEALRTVALSEKLNDLAPELLEFFLRLTAKLMAKRPRFVAKSKFVVAYKVKEPVRKTTRKEKSSEGGDEEAEEEEGAATAVEQSDEIELDETSLTSEPSVRQIRWCANLVKILSVVPDYLLGLLATPLSRQHCLHLLVPVTNWLSGLQCPIHIQRALMFIFGDFIKCSDFQNPTTRAFAFPTLRTLAAMISGQCQEVKRLVDDELFVKEPPSRCDMLKKNSLLAAEREDIDHYLWIACQSLYSVGVWFRKINEEMFLSADGKTMNEKDKEATLTANRELITSCIEICFKQGTMLCNLHNKLLEEFDAVLSKNTYFPSPSRGAQVSALPGLADNRILVVHCFCRIILNFLEFIPRDVPLENIVTSILNVITRCCDNANAVTLSKSSDPLVAMLVTPAAELAVGILFEMKDTIFVTGLGGNGYRRESELGVVCRKFLMQCGKMDKRGWQRPFVPDVVKQLMIPAQVRNDNNNNDGDDDDNGNEVAGAAKGTRGTGGRRKRGEVRIPKRGGDAAPTPECKQQ